MITKKQILCLIALAIILVIVSVACKKNLTNSVDYMVVKQAEQSPQPEKKLTIDTNQGLIQFKDLSFKSGAYYINGNYTRKIYYYADIKVDENLKPYISAITKSEDGEIIEDEGKFYETSTNESGEFYNLEGVRYQSGNMLTAEATFNESGYLVIRFSNYSLDITYSLLNEKAPEGENDSNERKLSFYAGNWYGVYEWLNKLLLTINTDGSVIFYEDSYVGSDAGSKIITIPYSSMTKTSGGGSTAPHTLYERYSFSYGGTEYSLTFYTNEAHYTWGGWGTTFNSMLGGGHGGHSQLIYHERHKDLYKDLQ
ncbi:hypothetical protein [Brachyspira sp.]|uniref:hypothetical protein n=1 Tax=Brachyspira sp. TaxID=1977261 RepID=UPI003D7E8B0F